MFSQNCYADYFVQQFTLITDDWLTFDWLFSWRIKEWHMIALVIWMILLSRGHTINSNRFWDSAFVYQLNLCFHCNKSLCKLTAFNRYTIHFLPCILAWKVKNIFILLSLTRIVVLRLADCWLKYVNATNEVECKLTLIFVRARRACEFSRAFIPRRIASISANAEADLLLKSYFRINQRGSCRVISHL